MLNFVLLYHIGKIVEWTLNLSLPLHGNRNGWFKNLKWLNWNWIIEIFFLYFIIHIHIYIHIHIHSNNYSLHYWHKSQYETFIQHILLMNMLKTDSIINSITDLKYKYLKFLPFHFTLQNFFLLLANDTIRFLKRI